MFYIDPQKVKFVKTHAYLPKMDASVDPLTNNLSLVVSLTSDIQS